MLERAAEDNPYWPRGWTLLTGKREDIDLIRRKLGFYDPDPQVDASLAQRAGMVRIGNDALGRWSMMSMLLTPERLINAIVQFIH